MTAGPDVPNESAEDDQKEQSTAGESNVPTEIHDIFTFLSSMKQITFKSQQIDDPELLPDEKAKIAHDIYTKSKHTFLMRFGSYLREEHLTNFERLCITNDGDSNTEQKNEMELMVEDYRQRLKTRKLLVKNRRYAAMQDLIVKGDYFSELEMMKRSPELYEELIGQYMNETEKKLRDGYDVKNTTFSGILMHTMEQREINDVMQEAAKQIKKERKLEQKAICNAASSSDSSTSQSTTTSLESTDPIDNEDNDDVPVNCRQQWGNFDNEQQACSTSKPIKPKKKHEIKKNAAFDNYITAGERELLRHEFLGLMYEQFLAGDDADFDYESVDNDSKLDDLQQLNQDKEDEYFEASDDDEEQLSNDSNNIHSAADESEDELDRFMEHLSKHHSLQQH